MLSAHTLIALLVVGYLLYSRSSFVLWTVVVLGYLLAITFFGKMSLLTLVILWPLAFAVLAVLGLPFLRKIVITSNAYQFAKKQLPTITPSEREALKAGTVTWDGELFSGMPDWNKLYSYEPAKLSIEEQEFMEGPVQELTNHNHSTWDMYHKDLTYRKDILELCKKHRVFGMITSKEYGGLGFDVTGVWQINMLLGSKLGNIGTWIGIASSIGAGELIERYGSKEQKEYYLPRLSKGDEIPCFALTSPIAGSDATSIEDNGVVCKGEFEGKEVLGIKLNFNKRYITLGCDATLMSLAFKLYDPDHLLGDKENIGVTVAIVPTNLKGIKHGRRHYPVGLAFPNGPLQGKDVFIPVENILGGVDGAGHGWEALTQCLATGRATSLPTRALTATKSCFYTTAVYTGIRKQFGLRVGQFESVQEKLAELSAYTYITDAMRLFTFAQIQAGERPAIPSAMSKYMSTDLSRLGTMLAMDLQAGKAVMNGPNNMVADFYTSAPMPITVEGSNTMTRGLIVFGQGAVRCHPNILPMMAALEADDKEAFDSLIVRQMNFTASNHVRSLFLNLTNGIFVSVPETHKAMKRNLQKITKLSSSFALMADMSMILLGGKLKRMEALSGRFADVFSLLYMASAAVKHFRDKGYPEDLEPVVQWSIDWALNLVEQRMREILDNFPNVFVRTWLKVLAFPLGRWHKKPKDKLTIEVANVVQASRKIREELAEGIYIKDFEPLERALHLSHKIDPINKRIMDAVKEKQVVGYTYLAQVADALKKSVISKEEEKLLQEAHAAIMAIINVDDFSLKELHEQK